MTLKEKFCEHGSVMVEAAVAVPLFILLVFTFVSFAQILDARSTLYNETSRMARSLKTLDLECDDNLQTVVSSQQTKIEDALLADGYASTVEVLALTSASDSAVSPEDVTQWRINATVTPACALCGVLSWLGAFSGQLNADTTVSSEIPGCRPVDP